jgi:hypothetical protein
MRHAVMVSPRLDFHDELAKMFESSTPGLTLGAVERHRNEIQTPQRLK